MKGWGFCGRFGLSILPFLGGGCTILWVLLTHLEAFLSKDFLVEEHTAKCVISDTSPVPSSTGLNLCSLSCIPLCRDMKKISFFSFISPHTSFPSMHWHLFKLTFLLYGYCISLWVFWKDGPSLCTVGRARNYSFSSTLESRKDFQKSLNSESFHWQYWALNQDLDIHSSFLFFLIRFLLSCELLLFE